MQIFRFFCGAVLLLFSTSCPVYGQSNESSGDFYTIALLIVIGALILVSAILMLSENLIQIEAQKSGIDTKRIPVSLFPSFRNIFNKPAPPYVKGEEFIDLRKGHDIKLSGTPSFEITNGNAKRYAIRPPDFRGISPIPRVLVNVGDEVKAGDILFHDKKDDRIKYVAPVSGEVIEVRRGEKRAITEIIILADKKINYRTSNPPSINEAGRKKIVDFLCETGGWTLINERPFDQLPDPESVPDNIFISSFDTAPLAPDQNFIVEKNEKFFQAGLDTLSRLTEGKVHLGLSANGDSAPHRAFVEAKGVEKHWFRGKHPAGNVGVQIHHISPIKPGSKVWTLGVQEVIALGELMLKGIFNANRVVALTGSKIKKAHYISTYLGANVSELIGDELISDVKLRLISGDVLSGRKVGEDDFLDYRCDQITVIKEGDYYELFGWLFPVKPRPSLSRTFPNFLFKDLEFEGDTNTHGEKRAFVMTGEYENVLPMNLYPQHLLKAILTNDFEQMEGLGIYELTEEDLALCEFACTSKIPVQSILREGLDLMKEQA